MKMNRKVTIALIVSLIFTAYMALTVHAAGSSVIFKGQAQGFELKPGSEYTDTDLFGGLKKVVPGDTVREEITITNNSADCDCINVYLRALPHDDTDNPLSPKVSEKGETVASMRDFLSKLSMKVWNGTELIYSSSPDQTDGLTTNKFLGSLHKGDSSKITIELTVPSELGNEYANRAGEVDWVFHVEGYSESQLTARKVWSDGNAFHAGDSIIVNLLKDGRVEARQELNAQNNWTYTFDRLAEGHTWTVEEASVPEGYTVSYYVGGNVTTILNTRKGGGGGGGGGGSAVRSSRNITVSKVWSSDDASKRPSSVTVTLYDGMTAYGTVELNTANNWTYTWNNLSSSGNWQVMETGIPKGYTPSYSASGDTVVITNTAVLIQTGQDNLTVWILGGAGIALLVLGAFLLRKRRTNA